MEFVELCGVYEQFRNQVRVLKKLKGSVCVLTLTVVISNHSLKREGDSQDGSARRGACHQM